MESTKLGLVFSGGGGKGAYEIGVWRALEEFNVCPQIRAISGTSVGALNAALFAQGDLALAEKLWRNMTEGDILHRAPEDLTRKIANFVVSGLGGPPSMALNLIRILRSKGTFSRKGLLRLMENNLDAEKVTHGGRELFATCRKEGTAHIRHFSLTGKGKERLHSALLASSAIPIIFPPEIIDGAGWFDGGFPSFGGSNTPIKPVYDVGCRIIFAVLLDMDTLIDVSAFPDAQIIFIYPQVSNGGLIDGSLDFDGVHADCRMNQGYADTVRILEPIYRIGVAQRQYAAALEVAKKQQIEFKKIVGNLAAARTASDISKTEALKAINDLEF